MDVEQMGPQTFLYGCELKEGKEVTFSPEDDDFEHQLSIRMVCVDPATKDELNIVEVEGQDSEGQKVKAVLATLKPSTLPSVCLGGFEIAPPVVFRLRSGAGPVHISGQHLVITGGDESFDEEEEEEEEELRTAMKRAAPVSIKSSKKMKMEEEDEDDDDEDDDEDDEDDEEEEELEETPVKAKKPAAKPQTPAQNGKGPKPNTPAAKQNKTPESGKKNEKKPQTPKSPKSPKTPQAPLTVPEIKAKMMASVEKGVSLPKLQPKFENYVKNGFKVTDPKVVEELWKWRQTVKEKN
ncbi:nucleophosmin 1a isoform X2 [Colossoma macropomum]|uniref:nucleophosmin 1a isoform X2 n=1 Tax=Colossoma macropomum TaxID=42526 RepID=UPI001864B001|nr:nucleophosmin 1a isoform X2 [Colossoma macropomum]